MMQGILSLAHLRIETIGVCVQVVHHMLSKAKTNKVLQFRHCARFLPCTHICRADKDAITATAKELAAEAFDCCALLYLRRVCIAGTSAALESATADPLFSR